VTALIKLLVRSSWISGQRHWMIIDVHR